MPPMITVPCTLGLNAITLEIELSRWSNSIAAAGVEVTKQTRLFFKVCIKASAIFSGLNMT